MSSLTKSLSKYILFSYHKNHQEVILKVYNYLINENLPVLIDIQDGINKNIYDNMDGMIESISGLICFLSPMYESSKRCQLEIQFAKTEGIPIIACRLLPNWKPSGWLNKIIYNLSIIDLQDLHQKNFHNKIKKLEDKIIWLLDNGKNSPIMSYSSNDMLLIDRSLVLEDSYMESINENLDLNYLKKQPINYRALPSNCRLYLSNLMVCNNEYILINGNNHLHLFDKNLKLIRSNQTIKINETNLRDLIWCSNSNNFIILTRKQIYFLNPITCKLSIIENIKLTNGQEEFISCSCSDDKFFLITCQLNSNTFFFHEFNLPTFRFLRKLIIRDFMGTSLYIQNGFFNKYDIQQIVSIRYFQQRIAIIMEINSHWFIYIFNLYEKFYFLKEIPLDNKSRMIILNSINQWILFKDYLANSFIQINLNQNKEFIDYSKGFIDFGGQIFSAALLGTSNLVFIINNTLVLYKI
ncbi:unnamed protein product [Adineta steineri]|uniref:TIR domain-containing protein n=1 Tax=Adineta steineri TaxID=433720 RepID=A0A814QIM5_9BILA|nr:unnamed protein product [Adineta steineri]CAF1121115.1 unnamed protein product [Adineta steineri]